ncbi:hypothetical protein [Salinibacillus xinjiangensis]|nr:hypothetical protein [Salinibacillus xinjiangensis]
MKKKIVISLICSLFLVLSGTSLVFADDEGDTAGINNETYTD